MDFTIDISKIILFIVTLIFAVISRYFIPWLKSKLDEHSKEEIKYWIGVFVSAAESYFGKDMGAEKKAWVIDQAIIKFNSLGIKIDGEEIQDIVESVYREAVQAGLIHWGQNKATREDAVKGNLE